MPKSRRDKKVSLTKTNKKGLEQKQSVIEDIQSCAEKYDNIFIFSVDNMRNTKLKEIRSEWKDSRLFFGKNSIMKIALGRTDASEDFIERLIGQMGVLFTSHSKDTVLDWFKEYTAVEFARSGFKTSETVVLPAGPMEEFSHAIEPHLRKLGMPTKLERGIVTLMSDYTVCKKGNVLTPEQAKILKLVGKPLATFRVNIDCFYSKENGLEICKGKKSSLKIPMKAKNKLLKKGQDKVKSKKAIANKDDSDDMEVNSGEEESDDSDDMDASD